MLPATVRKVPLLHGRNSTGGIPVEKTQLAICAVAGHMRRRVDNHADMAYEQAQEYGKANVSGGRSHARYDRLRLWLFTN